MTKVLFLGDTHGNMPFLEEAIYTARAYDCDALFQVGDFGFLWPGSDRLAEVDKLSRKLTTPIYWIDGNHDLHPEIRKLFPATSHLLEPGLHHVRRGCTVTLSGPEESTMTICGLGGAPSIDKGSRLEGKSWWPEETITSSEAASVPTCMDIDVLATHDAPEMPPGFGPIPGWDEFNAMSKQNAAYIRTALFMTTPEFLIHGHWHKRYSRKGLLGNTQVLGLGFDGSVHFNDTYVVIEKDLCGNCTLLP